MTERKKKKATVVSFVLDETGSMSSIKDDTIGGFNEYLDQLKKDKNSISFSLVKFDSNRIDKVHVGVPVKDVPHLTAETYRPGAMTPLIDAVFKTIKATQGHVKKRGDKPNVVVVVQTDGYENASTEHTSADLAALIKDLTAKGWQFVFLGAGIDAWGSARKFGFSCDTVADYSRAKSGETFTVMAAKTRSYAATGSAKAMQFTASERLRMADDSNPASNGGPKSQSMTKPVSRAERRRRGMVEDFTL